nr:proteasome maturation protein [Arenicola marina]
MQVNSDEARLRRYIIFNITMSLGYPPLRPKPEGSKVFHQKEEGSYEIPDLMVNGLQSAQADLTQSHALEYSEKHWRENKQKLDMAMLRNMQGIHAPLRLQMEQRTANKVGRLPCMHSSRIMIDNLMGNLDVLDFEDILNNPMDAEVMGQPHALVERDMKIL